MRQLLRRKQTRAELVRDWVVSDRSTVALAAAAIGTAGLALGGQFARLLARRRQAHPEDDVLFETAPAAAADTVTVAVDAYASAPRSETVLFNLLSGFLGAFALVRLSTWGIRDQWWPLGNVRVRGRHIHHFVPGILLAFAAGIAALLVDDEKVQDRLAIPMGVGMGLTFDEAALLLDLRDVYWSREGLLSVQLSFGLVALLSATILAIRMLRRAEQHQEDIGAIPQAAPSTSSFSVLARD
jgi:hypothetical protein